MATRRQIRLANMAINELESMINSFSKAVADIESRDSNLQVMLDAHQNDIVAGIGAMSDYTPTKLNSVRKEISTLKEYISNNTPSI